MERVFIPLSQSQQGTYIMLTDDVEGEVDDEEQDDEVIDFIEVREIFCTFISVL